MTPRQPGADALRTYDRLRRAACPHGYDRTTVGSDCRLCSALAFEDFAREARVPCKACGGRDTAKAVDALCYNCRNKPGWENEDLRTDLARAQEALSAAKELLNDELGARQEAERLLAIAQQASKAQQDRAEKAERERTALELRLINEQKIQRDTYKLWLDALHDTATVEHRERALLSDDWLREAEKELQVKIPVGNNTVLSILQRHRKGATE